MFKRDSIRIGVLSVVAGLCRVVFSVLCKSECR